MSKGRASGRHRRELMGLVGLVGSVGLAGLVGQVELAGLVGSAVLVRFIERIVDMGAS
jgi:hypothetical protein